MAEAVMRTHVVVPRRLVESVDGLVGRRGRSRLFVEALEEKLAHIRRLQLARQVVGSLADVDTPGWETTEAAAEWVRASRRAGDARLSSAEA